MKYYDVIYRCIIALAQEATALIEKAMQLFLEQLAQRS